MTNCQIINLPHIFTKFSIFDTTNHFNENNNKTDNKTDNNTDNDITYISIFHYISCRKALLFEDFKSLKFLQKLKDHHSIINASIFIKNFNQETWFKHLKIIICDAYYLKLSQHNKLRKILSSTHENIIVDPNKLYYHTCFFARNLSFQEPFLTNVIGECLMYVRNILDPIKNKK